MFKVFSLLLQTYAIPVPNTQSRNGGDPPRPQFGVGFL